MRNIVSKFGDAQAIDLLFFPLLASMLIDQHIHTTLIDLLASGQGEE
jgi:hypothetical protein